MNRHEEVVRILLGQGNVNAQGTEEHGRTPLTRAAVNGHEGVVKILLERNDVDPDTADKYYVMPLLWAAWGEHVGIMKILLERMRSIPTQLINITERHSCRPLGAGMQKW